MVLFFFAVCMCVCCCYLFVYISISWYVVDRTCALHQRNEPRKFMFYHQPTQNSEMKWNYFCVVVVVDFSFWFCLFLFYFFFFFFAEFFVFFPLEIKLFIGFHQKFNEENEASNSKSSHYRNEFKQNRIAWKRNFVLLFRLTFNVVIWAEGEGERESLCVHLIRIWFVNTKLSPHAMAYYKTVFCLWFSMFLVFFFWSHVLHC